VAGLVIAQAVAQDCLILVSAWVFIDESRSRMVFRRYR